MKALATHLRYLQFLAHNAHNQVEGPSFFADHAFLGELYPVYEDAYDAVVERLIGAGEKPDLVAIQAEAAAKLPEWSNVDDAFDSLLLGEAVLCRQIETLAKGEITQGTLNLLAGLADASEVRVYKLQQRRA